MRDPQRVLRVSQPGFGSRSVRVLAGGLVSVALLSCAGEKPVRLADVKREIVGHWRNEREPSDRSGWRRALDILEGGRAPQPRSLVIRADGSFEAEYGASQLRRLGRILGRSDLESPVAGHWKLDLDWRGNPWLTLDPGAPPRRVSVQDGRLLLHSTGDLWDDEHYAPAPAAGAAAETG